MFPTEDVNAHSSACHKNTIVSALLIHCFTLNYLDLEAFARSVNAAETNLLVLELDSFSDAGGSCINRGIL